MFLLVLVIAGHQRRDLGVEFCAENTFKVCLLGPKPMPILLVNNFNTTRKSPQNGFLTLARRSKIAQKFRILRIPFELPLSQEDNLLPCGRA